MRRRQLPANYFVVISVRRGRTAERSQLCPNSLLEEIRQMSGSRFMSIQRQSAPHCFGEIRRRTLVRLAVVREESSEW